MAKLYIYKKGQKDNTTIKKFGKIWKEDLVKMMKFLTFQEVNSLINCFIEKLNEELLTNPKNKNLSSHNEILKKRLARVSIILATSEINKDYKALIIDKKRKVLYVVAEILYLKWDKSPESVIEIINFFKKKAQKRGYKEIISKFIF